MSLINMTIKHGQTLGEAQVAMEQATRDIQTRFGRLVRRAQWDDDRNRVRIEGVGFWVEIRVDPQEVHLAGDIPILGGLLGSPLGAGLKQIIKQRFEKALPGRTSPP